MTPLTNLRSNQIKGEKWFGIDVMKAKVGNMKTSDIIEPLAVKQQIVSAASEAACMILRIDDVIATAKSAGPPPGAEGGMHQEWVECHQEWVEWVECQIWAE